MSEPQTGTRHLLYRLGEAHATRKDLKEVGSELVENSRISCSAELAFSQSEDALDQEIALQVDSWNASFKVTMLGHLSFEGEVPPASKVNELRRGVLIPGVCHAAFAQISLMCRQIDVDPVAFPVEMIDGLINADVEQFSAL